MGSQKQKVISKCIRPAPVWNSCPSSSPDFFPSPLLRPPLAPATPSLPAHQCYLMLLLPGPRDGRKEKEGKGGKSAKGKGTGYPGRGKKKEKEELKLLQADSLHYARKREEGGRAAKKEKGEGVMPGKKDRGKRHRKGWSKSRRKRRRWRRRSIVRRTDGRTAIPIATARVVLN